MGVTSKEDKYVNFLLTLYGELVGVTLTWYASRITAIVLVIFTIVVGRHLLGVARMFMVIVPRNFIEGGGQSVTWRNESRSFNNNFWGSDTCGAGSMSSRPCSTSDGARTPISVTACANEVITMR